MPRVGENGQEQQEQQQQHQNQNININADAQNINVNQNQNLNLNQQPQLLNVMPVATHLNIGDTQLTQVDTQDDWVDVKIMKNAAQLPLVQANAPLEQQVLDAHNRIGLNLAANSIRHSHRVKNARIKLDRQDRLRDLKVAGVDYDAGETQAILKKIEHSKNLKGYLYGSDGNSGEENLIRHYEEIKKVALYLPVLENAIEKENNRQDNGPKKKQYILELQAKVSVMKDIEAYYQTLESWTLNKYYALLPRGEMLKLSYEQLRIKLDELYRAENRNDELILYYQDLIRLKQLNINEETVVKNQEMYLKELKELNTPSEDNRTAKNEIKKIASSYKELLAANKKKEKFLKASERELRVKQFFEVYAADIQKFRDAARGSDITALLNAFENYQHALELENAEDNAGGEGGAETTEKYVSEKMPGYEKKLDKSKTTADGISLSEKQKEALNRVQGFILRRALRDGQDAFSYHFLQVRPEQQMLIFYLIENGKTAQAMGSDMIAALIDYKPDLNVIKDKLSFRVSRSLNWNLISQTAQIAKKYGGEIADFAQLSDRVQHSDKELKDVDKNDYGEQGRIIMESIASRSAMLELLYRNAGMNYAMPPDMAQDRKLREKLYTEYAKIAELSQQLANLIKRHGVQMFPAMKPAPEKEGEKIKEPAQTGTGTKVLEGVKTANTYLSYATKAENFVGKPLDYFISAVKEFRSGEAYGFPSYSINALANILMAITSIYGIAKVYGNGTLSVADKAGQFLSNGSSLFTGISKGGESIVKTLKLTGTVGQGVADITTTVVGITGIVTGTVKAVAGGVQLGRQISSGHDVKRAKEELEELKKRKALQKRMHREEGPLLNADEEKLKVFLNHQERNVSRQKKSAGVTIAAGAASAVAGVLTVTGILAPLGLLLGVTASVADTIYTLTLDRKHKKENRMKAVDEYLRVDQMVEELKNKPEHAGLKEDKLRELARNEAMAQIGFATYRECFKHICTGIAEVLYKKVFVEAPADENEAKMYKDAIKSIGLKVQMPVNGKEAKPTVAAMVAKLMA